MFPVNFRAILLKRDSRNDDEWWWIVSCGMVNRRKTLISLISRRDHCQISSPSWISDTPQAGIEPEFRFCWMKLCSSNNHYTTALLCAVVNFEFWKMFTNTFFIEHFRTTGSIKVTSWINSCYKHSEKRQSKWFICSLQCFWPVHPDLTSNIQYRRCIPKNFPNFSGKLFGRIIVTDWKKNDTYYF